MKRYQQPEVFEQLAAEYVLGTLQGKARLRFEALMVKHTYLQAIVAAWQQRLSASVEYFPETTLPTPSLQVWKNIKKQIKDQQEIQKNKLDKAESLRFGKNTYFWKKFRFSSIFITLLMSFIVLFLSFSTNDVSSPNRFSAQLKMKEQGVFALFKAQKSPMKLSLDVMKTVDIAEGMGLQLWCTNGQKVMSMGSIEHKGHTQLAFNKETWNELTTVEKIFITIEPLGIKPLKPSGKKLLEGQLLAMN